MKKEIAKIIDHTNIKLTAKTRDIKKTCQEAKEFGFREFALIPSG